MPTYPVKHKESGEEKELTMSMSSYSKWRDENPDWDRDWSKGAAGVGEVGDWSDKLMQKHPGFNDVLHAASKQPGAVVRPF